MTMVLEIIKHIRKGQVFFISTVDIITWVFGSI